MLLVPTRVPAKAGRLEGDTVATGATAVPVRLAAWVLPAAPFELSVTVTLALRAPAAVGLKLTVIEQLALAAIEVAQLFVCPKSPALLPPMTMLVMVSVVFPVLLRVML